MSENFKAIVVNQNEKDFTREVKSIDKNFLKHGDVLVKVDYSGLNYKDALILKNGARLVKEFPHIPGIDFSGKVVESDNTNYSPANVSLISKVNPSFSSVLSSDEYVKQVVNGNESTCAVTTKGKLWCWGQNSNGQLGDGGTSNRSVPYQTCSQ